jgi:outer membrane protein TolC
MGLALIACAELTCGVALPAAADASRPETDPVTTRDLQVSVGGLPSRPEPDGEVGRQTVTVNLRRAIDLALKANPELRAGSSDVEALEAQRDRAAGELWPSLRAIGAFTEYRRLQRLYPAAVSGEPAALSHHVAGADAVLSLPLFTGGRLRANLAAAERTRDAASHTLARTQAEIAFAVTGLYYALLAQRQLSAALASSEAGLVEQVRRLDALVRERKAAPLDRQRVEVRLAAVRQRRIQEENLKDIQLLSLGSLLGIDTAHTSLVVEGALARPAALPRWPMSRTRTRRSGSSPGSTAIRA